MGRGSRAGRSGRSRPPARWRGTAAGRWDQSLDGEILQLRRVGLQELTCVSGGPLVGHVERVPQLWVGGEQFPGDIIDMNRYK